MIRAILSGAAFAVVMSFPTAVVAVAFRFPIPFGGSESRVAAVPQTILAVACCGMLGGFPLLGLLDAGAGLWAWRREGATMTTGEHTKGETAEATRAGEES